LINYFSIKNMAQITHGIRSFLSSPFIYSSFQAIMGAHSFRKYLINQHIHPFVGLHLLDIGCGPGDLLSSLSNIEYWGFDISRNYINHAQIKFGSKGTFTCKQLTIADLDHLPKFDVVVASGLLHHMDDDVALECLNLAHQALKPGGRLVTVDPCWEKGQNLVTKFLINLDRGQNVRNALEYENLVSSIFSTRRVIVRHKAWIPYTHCIMECQKS
jgi:2-polyprenyl-3-methyl-5-hydroxy-6-metoxy-1,4-benzoquinol methylase